MSLKTVLMLVRYKIHDMFLYLGSLFSPCMETKVIRKKIAIIGIIALLICVGLSGCTDSSNINDSSSDTNKVEIVNYEVFTKWKVFVSINKTGIKKYNLIETAGIQQNEPNNTEEIDSYIVRGTIKNNAGYLLDEIEIIANYYDNNNVFLNNKSITVYNLQDTSTQGFAIKVDKNDIEYLDSVASVKLEVSA
jgi:hypothetical protein